MEIRQEKLSKRTSCTNKGGQLTVAYVWQNVIIVGTLRCGSVAGGGMVWWYCSRLLWIPIMPHA